MSRLIETFRKLPSPANRVKLQSYLDRHAMAICMALPEEIAFLTAHEFSI